MARKELEIRITVPSDNDRVYLSEIFAKALRDHLDYVEACGPEVPNSGRQVFDEAFVWWAVRNVP